MKQVCGTCKHHRRLDFVDWFCGNQESPLCNKETEYHDTCEAYEALKIGGDEADELPTKQIGE